jgi:hypothetical protein
LTKRKAEPRGKTAKDRKNIYLLRALQNPDDEWGHEQNQKAKEQLLSNENINRLVIGLVHFCFRNGPVEDMHTNGKLSQSDMATLNHFMVNRLALVITLAKENRWTELEILLQFDMMCGTDWDAPSADFNELYDILLLLLRSDSSDNKNLAKHR